MTPRHPGACAGDLIAVVEIVEDVEDRVLLSRSTIGRSGKTRFMASQEDLPFEGAVEIVAHEEAAAEEVFAEAFGLRVGELPVADFDAVEPGPVVLVAVVEIDGLLDGAGVDPLAPIPSSPSTITSVPARSASMLA